MNELFRDAMTIVLNVAGLTFLLFGQAPEALAGREGDGDTARKLPGGGAPMQSSIGEVRQ